MMKQRKQERWIVEVRNGKNREVVSERYYDDEAHAMAAYWRAKIRHGANKLLEIRVWNTDVTLPVSS